LSVTIPYYQDRSKSPRSIVSDSWINHIPAEKFWRAL